MTSLCTRLRLSCALGLLSLALLGGCASTRNPQDPLEPLNRVVYKLNDGLDKVVLKPVATVYKTVLPQFVRTRGGAYFFLPGISALRYLQRLPASVPSGPRTG